MILDPATGIITLDSGTCLGPELTRAAFLAAPEGHSAEPWAGMHYRFFTAEGTMGMVAYFYPPAWQERSTAGTDLISSVMFWLVGAAYPSGWGNYTPEREQLRRADTRKWLAAQGVELHAIGDDQYEARYAWGNVGMYYDFREGGFYEGLRYARS